MEPVNDTTALRPASIGVILVHGIGEQRRFEHLDWQGREIIRALKLQDDYETTVEIGTGPAAPFHAEQDTWAAGPHGPVRVLVREKATGHISHCIHFHEVWWADVNERYSVAKQLRFWAWGLAIWCYPGKGGRRARKLAGFSEMTAPSVPGARKLWQQVWNRLRLFMVGFFFALAGFSVGLVLLLAQRLLNLKTPDLLKTLSNYISGVKLFNQRSRFGPNLSFWPANEDFLDTLDEPPRVSVRRRMIRTIANVALADYDRWYVVAHSQGTVAAFNGLMESPRTWPGYFTQEGWQALRDACLAGMAQSDLPPAASDDSMPCRPVWAPADEIAYRARIFEKLRGILTLGSPLEKFAAIWPARVPISRIPAFQSDTVWLNILDPMDPVSGELKAYAGFDPQACPTPVYIGYRASWVLLLAHLRYTTWSGKGCLADAVAKWLLDGDPTPVSTAIGTFKPRSANGRFRSAQANFRTVVAWAYWLVAFALLSIAGGLSIRFFSETLPAINGFADIWHWAFTPFPLHQAVVATVIALAATVFVGVLSRLALFQGADDPAAPPVDRAPLPDPGKPIKDPPRRSSHDYM